MAKRVPIPAFVDYMVWAYQNGCGYIMGSYGQDPKDWSKSSWWFTQYKGAQREKALYWREHAPLVFDCNGLAEGCYRKETGININARARNNFAAWCTNKGKGRIPAKLRVPGAAVFMYNGSYISHVGYLWKPVVESKPSGDWWVIEARGVMYGVVRTKLYGRKWNRYGWMTKYFDYDAVRESNDENMAEEPHSPDAIPDVYPVFRVCPDISKYQGNIDFDKFCAGADFAIFRARVNGKNDSRFKEYAAECVKRGFPFSVYDFITLTDEADAVKQAEAFYKLTSPFNPRIYYLDVETLGEDVGHATNRKLLQAYVARLRELGAERIGLYMGSYRFRTQYKQIAHIFDTLWLANWGKQTGYLSSVPSEPCDLHQYTSMGYAVPKGATKRVPGAPGIRHRIDLNRLTGHKPLSYFTGREHVQPEYCGIVRTTAASVNIRSGAGSQFGKLGVAAKGAIFERRIGDTSDWYAIFHKGKAAFISKKYCKAVTG